MARALDSLRTSIARHLSTFRQGLQKAFLLFATFVLLVSGQLAAIPQAAHAAGLTAPWWSGPRAVTQDYGCTADSDEKPATQTGRQCPPTAPYFHEGVDVGFGTECGAHIVAPIALTVMDVGGKSGGYQDESSYYGSYYPRLRTADGMYDIILAHVQHTYFTIGQAVLPNQIISDVGNEGASTGCHLHFEVRPASGRWGSSINPWPFFDPNSVGGKWISAPADGSSTLPDNSHALSVQVQVDDHTGTGLARVDFTYSADNGGHWSKWSSYNPASGSIISYNYPVPSGGWPTRLIISFDVYANNKEGTLSPNGMRAVCRPGTVTCPVATAIVSGGSGGGGAGGGGTSTGCVPGANQVSVFVDPNFGGSCVTKGVGDYNDANAIGLPDNSISSVKVGSGATAQLCDNVNINSYCEWFTADDSDLSNNSLNTDTVSSMRVTGTSTSTGCSPSANQVALYVDENYGGTCVLKGIGDYNTPSDVGLPNDSVSSIRIGGNVKADVCADDNINTCQWNWTNDVPALRTTSLGDNTLSSLRVESRGGIHLCDNTNYGGQCVTFGVGLYNMSDYGFDNRTESVLYDSSWANWYHIVLYTDPGQSGYLAHYDNSVPDLGSPYDNNISSIKIYKNSPPSADNMTPTSGTTFPGSTTALDLGVTDGDSRQVHVWGPNGYDRWINWTTATTIHISGLLPGTYSWQAQAQSNTLGAGNWSTVYTFTINRPPQVIGGSINVNPGTTTSVQISASDPNGANLTLSANNLPSFATFTDNGDTTGTLTLSPVATDAGMRTITIVANDGSDSGSGQVFVTVNPDPNNPPTGFRGEYYSNTTLAGSPTLVRYDPAINFDWYSSAPDPSVTSDFSARWTKTIAIATAGTYQFTATADDGVRLYVDDQLIIDHWIHEGATTYTSLLSLAAGNHTVKYEYFDDNGWATAKFSYQLVDTSGQYVGQYYSNTTLSGAPSITRLDPAINFDWGTGSPDPAVTSDFSARWTGTFSFAAGTYQFTATADDGVRLYIDNELIIDKWIHEGATTYIAAKQLTAGSHTIKYEYFDDNGSAVAKFSYQLMDPTQYTGEYFPTLDLSGTPSLIQSDPSISFDWGGASPGPNVPGTFSARWTKTVNIATSGIYEFAVTVDDGARLYIDNQLVLDKWFHQSATTYTVDRTLLAGNHTLRLEYFNDVGASTLHMSYSLIDDGSSDFLGEYYASTDLSGQPVYYSYDPWISFDWGYGSPDPSVPNDFSARWTRTTYLDAGTYAFSVTADDGVRLYVDEQLLIDHWIHEGATTYTAAIRLAAGNHTIKYEYFDDNGYATANLNYYIVDVTSGDYQASYWNNMNLSGTPVLTRNETAVYNMWGTGSPDPTVNSDNFSARWTKTATLAAGNYEFSVTADDGVRLYIDNKLAIDAWYDQAGGYYDLERYLSAGTHTITMEYYENAGDATAQLYIGTAAWAPTPSFTTTPSTGIAPLSVAVNASASTSPNGPIASYIFDFGDTTVVGPQASATASHVYTVPGTYTMTVYATDQYGTTTSRLQTITVNPTPPTAAMTVTPTSGVVPLAVSVDASGSAAGSNPISSYTFDFGDGTVTGPQASATATHTYTAGGTYMLKMTVKDSIGLTATKTQTMTVKAPPIPVLSVSPSSGTAALTVTASAAASTAGTSPIATYMYDFGDGTIVGPQVGSSASHIYTVAGTYTVTLTVADVNGLTATTNQTVTVTAPAATYAGQYYANTTLSGTPITRSDSAINFSWGTASPMTGIPVDNFSVRWTRVVSLDAGTYSFSTTADDGVRLYIDGTLVIDKWVTVSAPTTYTISKALAAGNHTIVVAYVSYTGSATAKFSYSLTSRTSPSFQGQYFANATLSGTPALIRSDSSINFSWGTGSPATGLPVDNFSVRWTRTSYLNAGTYRFQTTTDDGVRFYVDNQLIINRWSAGSASNYGYAQLAAGYHTFRMEYYEATGSATAQLSYYLFDNGLGTYQATYWNNTGLSGSAVLTRVDASINFSWGTGSPGTGVNADNFSTRWTKIATFTAGNHTFTTTTDDGVRLYIDDVLVINQWKAQSATYSVTKTLTAGPHKIRMEYYEGTGSATAKLTYN